MYEISDLKCSGIRAVSKVKRSVYGLVFFLVAYGVFSFSCTQNENFSVSFPDDLPPAKGELYKSVRDASEWENPYLIIGPDAVVVLGVEGMVPPGELPIALAALPKEAWPYGRIVAVQEVGIMSRDDSERIGETLRQTLMILEELDIEVSKWPSS